MNVAAAIPIRELDAALVREALKNAGSRSRMAWMAEQMGLAEPQMLPLAAKHFGMRALSMESLRRIQPDFSLEGRIAAGIQDLPGVNGFDFGHEKSLVGC